jgi:hypothetical protein
VTHPLFKLRRRVTNPVCGCSLEGPCPVGEVLFKKLLRDRKRRGTKRDERGMRRSAFYLHIYHYAVEPDHIIARLCRPLKPGQPDHTR